eukprot:gene8249-16967_t
MFLLRTLFQIYFLHISLNNAYTTLPIRVALAVDKGSIRDMIMISRSIIESVYEVNDIFLHVVSCGENKMKALELSQIISSSLKNCTPELHFDVTPFHLPLDSGFYHQLVKIKQKAHWSSSSGADMVRFYLPELFKQYDRILYLDNDILVTCCLEQVWSIEFESHEIAGVILDDLKWASRTQFQRHYNASHPLVQKNFRRKYSSSTSTPLSSKVTLNEWLLAMPKYPNDGVILFDIQKYNKFKLLDIANEIAEANSRGEYVVGIGSQQFTVLLLHDRWQELSPRANLRHFPDMARGFMMWFNYHGFIHYSGTNKPLQICNQGYHLQETCPNNIYLEYVRTCVQHQPHIRKYTQLLDIIPKLAYIYSGEGNAILTIDTNTLVKDTNTNTNTNRGVHTDDILTFYNKVIYKTKWTNFILTPIIPTSTSINLQINNNSNIEIKSTNKNQKFQIPLCEFQTTQTTPKTTTTTKKSNCKSFHDILNIRGLRHLDVIGITIDMNLNILNKVQSLQIIKSIDFDLIRPKFILMRIQSVNKVSKEHSTKPSKDPSKCIDKTFQMQIQKILRMNGFLYNDFNVEDEVEVGAKQTTDLQN